MARKTIREFVEAPTWTREQLLAVKHLGPAIIGEAMYEASQALATETNNGVFGPALLGELPDSYKDQRTLKQDSEAA